MTKFFKKNNQFYKHYIVINMAKMEVFMCICKLF